MIALNFASSNNPKIEHPFPRAGGRPPPMTRAERIWNLHRTIVDPLSDSEEVRRSKRAVLITLAMPDKLFQSDVPLPEQRTRQEPRHSHQSPFLLEVALS
jgi:hypothetical protein